MTKRRHSKKDLDAHHDRKVDARINSVKESFGRVKAAFSTGASRLADARVREIVPAATWGAMDMLTGGRHSLYQNQKLNDKVGDALGKPVRPARRKRGNTK
jgi:hypothetical protein